jgi:hypothetical protein
MSNDLTYSNPRLSAEIDNWPNGKHRVVATFAIERHPTRGERATRTTTGKPKVLTYARKARIVDADNGRTYIAELTFSHVSIMRADMKFQEETIFPDNPRFDMAMALFA